MFNYQELSEHYRLVKVKRAADALAQGAALLC
jgi:hypothetical protein